MLCGRARLDGDGWIGKEKTSFRCSCPIKVFAIRLYHSLPNSNDLASGLSVFLPLSTSFPMRSFAEQPYFFIYLDVFRASWKRFFSTKNNYTFCKSEIEILLRLSFYKIITQLFRKVRVWPLLACVLIFTPKVACFKMFF